MPAAFKKIKEYSALELDEAVNSAVTYCRLAGLDFWVIFNGIDAYIERRARKETLIPLIDFITYDRKPKQS